MKARFATAVVLGLITAGAWVPAAGASSTGEVPVGTAPHVLPSAHRAGTVPSSTPLRIDVVLSPRDPSALAAAVTSVSDPGSPAYHRFISQGAFARLFGPLPSTVESVRTTLTDLGLHPGPTSPNGLIIPVSATASEVEAAFRTHLDLYRVDGHVAFANQSAPLIPSRISPYVEAVAGLDTVDVPRPQIAHQLSTHGAGSPGPTYLVSSHSTGPSPCSMATQTAQISGAYTADQIAQAYGFTSAYSAGHLGSGQTIGLFELEPYSQADVGTFESCYGISTKVTPVNVDGGPGTGSGSGESILDIDNVVSLAPLATVEVYQGPQSSSLDVWNRIVTDDTAKVISTSWGICEPMIGSGVAAAENSIFQQAALQGQSILDASGDAGSEDCYQASSPSPDTELAVDDPASQPDVTAVGGTTLKLGSSTSETVWNNCAGQPSSCAASGGGSSGASGGGLSSIWTMPSWQSAPGVVNPFTSSTACPVSSGTGSTGSCREVPDVSALADPQDGYVIFCSCNPGSGWSAAGGTSAAAPVWAALVALANQACSANSGLLNPTLYSLATSHPADFRDITVGNNDLTGTAGGRYPATAGYDMASGLGSPTASLFQPGALCGTQPPPPPTPVNQAGYWMLGDDGTVYNFGSAPNLCGGSAGRCASGLTSAAGMAAIPGGTGYWVVAPDGTVVAAGSAPKIQPASPPVLGSVVAISATPTGNGYWLATSGGQVETAGSAAFYGDLTNTPVNAPIVDMASTPDGGGYWLLGADGGVFTFGDARFFGSTGNIKLNKPAVAMASTADGKGYWFVASDGGMFSFGDAVYYGSVYQLNPALPPGGTNSVAPIDKPANGIVVTSDGGGYWVVASDGGVFSFGDAGFVGSLGGQSIPAPIVAFAPV